MNNLTEEANRSHESESQSETDESEQKTKSIPLPPGVTNKEEGRKPRSAAWEIIHEQINMPASKDITIHEANKDDHKQIKLQKGDAERSSLDGVDCSSTFVEYMHYFIYVINSTHEINFFQEFDTVS